MALEIDVLRENRIDFVLVDVLDPYFSHGSLRVAKSLRYGIHTIRRCQGDAGASMAAMTARSDSSSRTRISRVCGL